MAFFRNQELPRLIKSETPYPGEIIERKLNLISRHS